MSVRASIIETCLIYKHVLFINFPNLLIRNTFLYSRFYQIFTTRSRENKTKSGSVFLVFLKEKEKCTKFHCTALVLYIHKINVTQQGLQVHEHSRLQSNLELFTQRKKWYVFPSLVPSLQRKIKAAKKQRFMVAFEVFSKPLLKLIHFLIPSFPSTYLCTFTNHTVTPNWHEGGLFPPLSFLDHILSKKY